jgi:hypothetical protein
VNTSTLCTGLVEVVADGVVSAMAPGLEMADPSSSSTMRATGRAIVAGAVDEILRDTGGTVPFDILLSKLQRLRVPPVPRLRLFQAQMTVRRGFYGLINHNWLGCVACVCCVRVLCGPCGMRGTTAL